MGIYFLTPMSITDSLAQTQVTVDASLISYSSASIGQYSLYIEIVCVVTQMSLVGTVEPLYQYTTIDGVDYIDLTVD